MIVHTSITSKNDSNDWSVIYKYIKIIYKVSLKVKNKIPILLLLKRKFNEATSMASTTWKKEIEQR